MIPCLSMWVTGEQWSTSSRQGLVVAPDAQEGALLLANKAARDDTTP
jgi:hypothetical protein